MKAIALIILISSVGADKVASQHLSLYSNEFLTIDSEYLEETIQLNLHLPETHPFSAQTTHYPITIIFDSQHDRTYPHILSSFDLLTSETQIPESIIIGVPFTMQNRLYLTSTQKKEGDSLPGIERMESFLFLELIPKLQKEWKGNDFITLIGHSRTAFLVNYLAFSRPSDIRLAISLSGFFSEAPLSIDTFYSFLTDSENFPHKFHYYYTAGTTLEEANYLTQFRTLDRMLSESSLSSNVKITFKETQNANHMPNYWVSLPPILIDAFSSYNSILDTWFFEKLDTEPAELTVHHFESDLAAAGNEIGVKLNPNLTHIYSLASHFAYSEEEYRTATDFINLGLSYYPYYLELYVDMIVFHQALNNIEISNRYKEILREKVASADYLNENEKIELLKYAEQN